MGFAAGAVEALALGMSDHDAIGRLRGHHG
jgi:hypothetical protein